MAVIGEIGIMTYATSVALDQPAHPHKLISVCNVRYSVIEKMSMPLSNSIYLYLVTISLRMCGSRSAAFCREIRKASKSSYNGKTLNSIQVLRVGAL